MTFKIIIDDGLHTADAQISTFVNLYHRVEVGGYYVIEDINQNHLFSFFKFALQLSLKNINYNKKTHSKKWAFPIPKF